jgi:branched-chain amino acid transport system substrate-binding protein
MSRRARGSRLIGAVALAVVAVTGAACGGSDSGSGGDGPVTIGVSIPLSGPLAGFGGFQKWGYQHAIDEVNAAGGVDVGGTKRKVNLVILDDKTDPNTTSANTQTLISKDKAVALLGSCTPALVNAGAVVADRSKIPMVTGCDPLEAFKSVKKWEYVWDLFFDEPDLAEAPFQTLDEYGSATNKKVAILHDNGPDGQVVGGQIWPAMAEKHGYTVASNAEFPTEETQFGSLVEQAKASGAEILLVDAITPQAIAIRKQLSAADWKPKVIVIEKGAEPVQFQQALGALADGVLVGGYWDSSFKYPGASDLRAAFEKETGQTYSQHIADSYAAAQILLDGIAAAGSTDADKINDALAKTDKTYVVGPIKFDENHTATLPIVELQWQGPETKVVWPKDQATGDFVFPVP